MYEKENYPINAAGEAMVGPAFHDRTIRENIDAQIKRALEHVARLERVKVQFEKTGLLDMKISDMRQAMNF